MFRKVLESQFVMSFESLLRRELKLVTYTNRYCPGEGACGLGLQTSVSTSKQLASLILYMFDTLRPVDESKSGNVNTGLNSDALDET